MKIDVSAYDVVDFGCSNGGSLDFSFKQFGCQTGLGIDIDPKKVEKARASGYNAVVGDLTQPKNFSGKTKIATLFHVLEHIPNVKLANQILSTATQIASDYVVVRQPWFDCDGLLARMGLKFFWSDWSGHTNHMTSLQMYLELKRQLDRKQISSFSVWGYKPVSDTQNPALVALDRPTNLRKCDLEQETVTGRRKQTIDCFEELVAFIGVSRDIDTTVLPLGFRQGGARLFAESSERGGC